MPAHHLDSVADPRLDAYRDLRNPSAGSRSGLFVAEGRWLVARLLSSRLAVHSVVVEARRAGDVARLLADEIPLYVIPDKSAAELVGFNFHRGVLACGVRPAPLELRQLEFGSAATLVLGCRLRDPENVGLMLRNCAAFGVDAMILGPSCVDPYARRVLRVSMGNAFFTTIVQSPNLEQTVGQLREQAFDVAATVLDDEAELLPDFRRGRRQALVFGEEACGVSASCIAACSRKLTLPMAGATDSLNVAVASGVFLYHITHGGPSPR